MGIAEDFRKFRGRYLIPTCIIGSISRRYRSITRRLNMDFYGSQSMTAHSLYVGSYGRDTAAYGISDLDVGFKLPKRFYTQYNKHKGNGQSALLQAVRGSLRKTFPNSLLGGDGQVVVIKFTDGITFEILPYFLLKGGIWVYPCSNKGGTWKKCNPRPEIAAIKARNGSTNKNLKNLCRMTRVWKDVHSVRISGMLIDTLAYQFIGSWRHRKQSYSYHDAMMRDFFKFLSDQDTSKERWRAPSSQSLVLKKGGFKSKARSAYTKASKAVQYNTNNCAWSRRQKWREIFGTRYPL